MNRAVIILCAGTSSRFSKSLNQEVLKVIYHENQPTKTILAYQLNSLKNAFNKIIIVGGYRIEELKNYVGDYFSNLEHIEIVNNRKFETDGTGYSFQLGINALKEHYDQVKRYLHQTNFKLGIVINFRDKRINAKRVLNINNLFIVIYKKNFYPPPCVLVCNKI